MSAFSVPTADQLGVHLRALRKRHGLTQQHTADRLGISKARFSAIERDPGRVSLNQLLHILHILNANLLIDDGSGLRTRAAGADRPMGEW